jgi:mono/diheme cytochrome c family protein
VGWWGRLDLHELAPWVSARGNDHGWSAGVDEDYRSGLMAEIPEHLLRRSKERRAAAGGGGDDAASEASAAPAGDTPSAAPAKATVAAAAPAAPPRPTVAAQPTQTPPLPTGRARFPVWVMPVIAVLPVFGFFYAQAFQTPPVEAPKDPLVLGAEIYRSKGCAGCHGATGEGGTGPALAGGQAVLTFPDEADHKSWVKTGSAPFAGQPYGDPKRIGGQHRAIGGMPAFGSLSQEELDAIVQYEREKL